MRHQEDIIKEKLGEFEEMLPEGSLADFRSRYDASKATSKAVSGRKPKRAVWYCAVPVFAACLAGIIIFTRSMDVSEVVRNDEPVELVAYAMNATDVPDAFDAGEVMDVAVVKNVPATLPERTSKAPDSIGEPEYSSDEQTRTVEEERDNVADEEETAEAESEMHPECGKGGQRKNVGIRVGSAVAAGGVLGGTIIGAVLASAKPVGGNIGLQAPTANYFGTFYPGSSDPNDGYTGNRSHSLPLKIGMSLRWKITDKLSFTSGLEYSLYFSSFNYSISGVHRQQAHYLGIPLRLDYSFARTRWLDVYAGAGGTADYCLAASENGVPIKKDGISFSLQGVAGMQVNFTRNFGAFIEPQVSWAIPSEGRVLETYRTLHPVSFNIAAGVRLTFEK